MLRSATAASMAAAGSATSRTRTPRFSPSWSRIAAASVAGSEMPGTGASGTWSGTAAFRSKPASSSAALPVGPLNSYHGVPAQPPATGHGAR